MQVKLDCASLRVIAHCKMGMLLFPKSRENGFQTGGSEARLMSILHCSPRGEAKCVRGPSDISSGANQAPALGFHESRLLCFSLTTIHYPLSTAFPPCFGSRIGEKCRLASATDRRRRGRPRKMQAHRPAINRRWTCDPGDSVFSHLCLANASSTATRK